MTRVAILPVPTTSGDVAYHAVAGDKRPDAFFDAPQQRRLSELMARWRAARDAGGDLPAAEQAELDDLIELEIRASAERAKAALHDLAQ